MDLLDNIPRGNPKKPTGDIPEEFISDPDEVVENCPFDPTQLLCGAVGEELVSEDTEQGQLHISGAGGGKTVGLISELIHGQGSGFVIDPKFTVGAATCEWRAEEMGHDVYIFAPGIRLDAKYQQYEATWNPLAALNPDEPDFWEKVGLIADALIIQDLKGESHWPDSAKTFLEGVIVLVKMSPFYQGERHLISVWSVIAKGEGIPDEDQPTIEGVVQLMLHQAKVMKVEYPDIADALESAARDFWERQDRERDSVLSSLRTQLSFMKYPEIRDILGHDDDDE